MIFFHFGCRAEVPTFQSKQLRGVVLFKVLLDSNGVFQYNISQDHAHACAQAGNLIRIVSTASRADHGFGQTYETP